MNINEKYIMVKTDELIPYEKNARTHSKEQIDAIADSFKRFGIVNPFLITADKNILAGHCRLLAAKQLGIENVPCILVDNLTADEQRAYIIADNKLAEAAGWDMDILTTELFELKDGGFELSLLGFSDMEISQIEDLSAGEIEEDDFDVELPKEPKSKVGDIYSLGDNRLMCGDCTNSGDVAKLMSGAVADMVLTDPPYNIAYVGKTKSKMTMQNDKMDDESYQAFLAKAFAAAKDILKDGGTFYIWHADNESFSVRKACNDVGLKIRQCLIWVKSCISLGRQDYQWKHEPCL
ncbi:MAG: ParB N-terminal domain-containing protein, partial [Clostridia bacterium]